MFEPIPDYYVAEFPTPDQAERIARAIADGCFALGMEYEANNALRAVIWAAAPIAATGTLYLSVGAMQIAQEMGIPIVPTRHLVAEDLPTHRALLLGMPQDRTATEEH
jgi:hypothetical protein